MKNGGVQYLSSVILEIETMKKVLLFRLELYAHVFD